MTDMQGTEDWKRARLGKVTASRIADVCAKTKTGYGASRANYMSELLIERLTGEQAEQFISEAMRWGTEHESEARAAYQFERMALVQPAGFVPHPEIPMSGASPDGFVGEEGMIETKCPNTATHLETLLSQKVPDKYVIQMQWQMACTGRAWVDFVSFDPRVPETMRLYVRRVHRDEARIKELRDEIVKFLAELDAKQANLNKLYAAPEPYAA